ncbi:MAG: sulfatase-like hydrolase/transferase [Acidobacteriota bacterium]|nr:sulfatase-like hydrolase/transferase [Acidobacteriota bacterium]
MKKAAGATIVLALLAAAIWWWPRTGGFTLEPAAGQNVLLITIDTLRADALSSYGGPARTPNLDGLAAGGARFTFAHAHAVVTLPSHTSILTGRLPYEHGMRDNSGFRVPDGTATLATRLKASGFSTGAFVGGFPLTKRFGLAPGFDAYDDQMPQMTAATAISMPERRADAVVSRAVEWIGAQPSKFFAWVHVFDPHSPYKPPPAQAGSYAGQPYYGEVAWVDEALGPLFAKLAALPTPTLVIVTSDHGESLGEHGEQTHGMFAYEPTLRVPLIVARIMGTGLRSAGGGMGIRRPVPLVIDTPVRHVDIAPTVLEAVGVGRDDTMPGSSMLPIIRGERDGDRPTYFEAMTYNLVRGWAPLRGVLAGRSKYIDLPLPELYDLAQDPKEATNLADRQGDQRAVLTNMLRGFDVAPPNRPGQESAAAREALRSLGYVTGSAPARASYTEADDPKRLVDVDNDLHRASEAFQAGRRADGIALLERAIARRPDTADAYITLAHAHWQAGQPAQAVAALERGLRNGAPDRDIRIRLATYISEGGGPPAKAVSLLEGLPDHDVEALNALGIAYGASERYAQAIATFRKALALDATNAIAHQNLASMTLREALGTRDESAALAKMREAESFARTALAADPELAGAHTIMGVILSGTGRKGEAIESWKRAVAFDAGEFNALYNLWLELAAAGRRDEAVAYGRQFVATAPPAFFARERAQISAFLGGR